VLGPTRTGAGEPSVGAMNPTPDLRKQPLQPAQPVRPASPGGPAPSYLRTFFSMLPFMLMCGMVGPIFIVIGLSSDLPGTEWLVPTGVLATGLVVAMAALLALLRHRGAARHHRLAGSGVVARADLLHVEQLPMTVNDQPVVAIRMRISGPGVEPFEVDRRRPVPLMMLPLLHRGVVAVLVDPTTRELEVEWDLTRLLTGMVPFTVDDTRDGSSIDLTGDVDAILAVLDVLRRHGVGATGGQVDLRGNDAARAEVVAVARQHDAR
jgi:hypothetical protein